MQNDLFAQNVFCLHFNYILKNHVVGVSPSDNTFPLLVYRLSRFPSPVVFVLTAAAHTYHMTACCDTSWVWTQPIRSNGGEYSEASYYRCVLQRKTQKNPPHSICKNQLLLPASALQETNRRRPKWSDITHWFLLEVDEGTGCDLSDEDQQEASKVLRGDNKQHTRSETFGGRQQLTNW